MIISSYERCPRDSSYATFATSAALADELHFGRAAARLAVSQPALSVQISQLEAMVGARLLDRHSRLVSLTEAGRMLAAAARRILRDVDTAIDAARRPSAGEVGVLRLGFGPTLMFSTLAQVVRTYRQRYPDVRMDLRELATGEQMDALLRGDLDLGFVRGAETDPRLHVELFAREPLLIALNRDHPAPATPESRLPRSPVSPGCCSPARLRPSSIRKCCGCATTPVSPPTSSRRAVRCTPPSGWSERASA